MNTLRQYFGLSRAAAPEPGDVELLDRFIRYAGAPYALAVRAPYDGAAPEQSVRLLCNLADTAVPAELLAALAERFPVRRCDALCVQMHSTPRQTELGTLLLRQSEPGVEGADWPQHLIRCPTNRRLRDWFDTLWVASPPIGAPPTTSPNWLCPLAQMQPLFPSRFTDSADQGTPVLVQLGGPDRSAMQQHLLRHCSAPEHLQSTWNLAPIQLLEAGGADAPMVDRFLYTPEIIDGLALNTNTDDGPVTGVWYRTCP